MNRPPRIARRLAAIGCASGMLAAAAAWSAPPAASASAAMPGSAPSTAANASAAAQVVRPAAMNAQDRRFVQAFGAGGFAAVDAASMAVVRSADPQVRAYAQQVARDRGLVNAQLASIARQAGLASPTGLDSAHFLLRQQLEESPPGQFERAYLGRELVDHAQTLELLQAEITGGHAAALRRLATSSADLVRRHDQQARAFASALGVAAAAPSTLGYGAAARTPLPTYAQAVAAPSPLPAVPVNAQDRRFVQELGSNGLAEIDAATLALVRAVSPQVREYAQQVARERAATQAQLAAAAQRAGLAMPGAIDGVRVAKRQRLDASTAPQFDLVYMTTEVADQQDALLLLQGEAAVGQEPGLRAAARAMLPVVQQHFQQAQALQVRAGGGLSPGLATVGADARALRR